MIEVGYVKEEVVQVNLEFINKFLAANLPELYLFCKLRLFSAKTGGKFANFKFTKNERYNVLPNLSLLGWVDIENMKVNKYRNILKVNKVEAQASFTIDKYLLQSMKSFKALVLAVNERYLLDCKAYRESRHPLQQVKKTVDCGNVKVEGRVFNADLSRIMGVSVPTVSRWRRESINEGFNEYDLKFVALNRDSLGKGNAPAKPFLPRLVRGSFFTCSDKNLKVTKDLIIKSSIPIFYPKSRHIDFKGTRSKSLVAA